MVDTDNVADFIGKNMTGIVISSIAMFMHILYDYTRGKKIKFTKFVINLILAGWVGYLCAEIDIPSHFIAIAGWCTIALLNILEEE